MENNISRRNFISKALGSIIGLQVLGLTWGYFRNSKEVKENNKWIELGKVNDFENGKTYSFPNNKVFLHCTNDGYFLALSNKCTHLGCAINLSNNSFVCPCHSSHFDELGNAIQAPAKRALDYFPIKILEERILVDLNNAQKRELFNKSQLTKK